MNQIIKELEDDNSVLLEIERLPEFLKFRMEQKECRAYRYEYSETLVKITQVEKEIKIKIKYDEE